MGLWRVDLCGVSHRFVEAASAEEASRLVVEATVAALDIEVERAAPELARAYDAAGPLQRRSLLARLDGLTNPAERRSSRAARRQLERLIRRDEEERAWASGLGVPPASPEVVDQVIRLLEVRHIEQTFLRLPEWDRKSPIHGE